ncbi:Asp23/Gls24 family envelope stress response protein [Streptomyces sp. NPDC051018]|uniref:Asp23/Gls24 family envelope stress response protein n=1 Tax=Streptomyces sp. NPDC051018 TaxID=3365639 RepID=UPI00378DCF35
MQTQQRTTTPTNASASTPKSARTGASTSGSAASRGTTTIAEVVVVKVAGMAAREVPGVHAMGGGLSRSLAAVRERVPGTGTAAGQGVKAEVGEKQAALDLDLVTEYGLPIHEVAADVRENVINAVERITGLEVIEVNVSVNDIHLPDDDRDDEEESAPARVRPR